MCSHKEMYPQLQIKPHQMECGTLCIIKEMDTCRPTVMLSKAISFFPALRDTDFLNLKGECVPLPYAVPEFE